MKNKMNIVLLFLLMALIAAPGVSALTPAQNYNASCAGCHGANMQGNSSIGAPNITPTGLAILGIKTVAQVDAILSPGGPMASQASSLSAADILALSQFLINPAAIPTTITVLPATAALAISETQAFNATVEDQNGTAMASVKITWASNNTQVGNVSPATATTDMFGNVTTTFTASAAGVAMVTAHDGTAVGSANVTVSAPVTVIPTTFNISGFKIRNDTGAGVQGWNITLMNSTMQTSMLTGADGSYMFTDLVNGTYNVTEGMMAGWTNVSPMSQQVTINGMDMMNVNFTNTMIPPSNRSFTAHLTGSDEVPPKVTSAEGQAIFNLSDDGTTLEFNVTVTNITNVTFSHIHLAPAGMNGSIVVFLYPGPTKDGMFDGTLAEGNITQANLTGPLKGQPLSALIDNMTAGNTYVNVHTTQNPAGEIRGQIMPAVAPSSPTFNISGFKINNATGSGVQGWNITLMNSTMSMSMLTGVDGSYKFMNLANGTYNVTERMMAGWTNVSPMSKQVTIAGDDMMNVNFTNQPVALSAIVTSFLLTPDTSVVLKGTTININAMALNGSLPQPLFNGMVNITITANNMSQVTFDQTATFVNGNATVHVDSSVGQFITVKATNGTITGSTKVEFADMVISLNMGFNLVSIPAFASPSDINQTLQLVKNNGVQTFNSSTGLFVTPTDLQPLFGYWINVTADNQKLGFIADTSSIILPPTRNLFEGWNLIGISSTRDDAVDSIRLDMTPRATFADLRNGDLPSEWMYSRLVSFDEATGRFTTFTAGVDLALDTPPLKQGHGYWLFIKSVPNTNKNNVPWAGKLW